MQGFSHRETVLLALMVRYHRKGELSADGYRDLLEHDDIERVARLTALLRLAEFLERRKSQVVQSLHVEIGDTVRVAARTISVVSAVESLISYRVPGRRFTMLPRY